MAIERKDVEKLATLSRLAISEATIEEVTASLSDVLDLVDQLQAADTDGIAPMAHPLDTVQRLRADEVSESNARETYQAMAPATEDGLYLVPKVVDQG